LPFSSLICASPQPISAARFIHQHNHTDIIMKAIRTILFANLCLALALPAAAMAASVIPSEKVGNFVSSDDDQVCYDMAAMGFIGEATGDLRGIKIDPPADFNDGYISTVISPDGRSLDWNITGADVIAFIIKGGSNFHVYDYTATGFDSDAGLVSPRAKRNTPQISHYNLCYTVRPQGEEGCTPGYWRNHTNRWAGVSTADDFDSTFGVDLLTPDMSLGLAIWANGGGANALARHATAALLNAHGGVPNPIGGASVNYPYSVAQVIGMVQQAAADGTLEALKDVLAAANELGCPLSGTRAD
jgi:hypothetical protein